jgi:hypothetical protein
MALFLGDYALTLLGARLAAGVADRIAFEGSYELNPFHAAAIDARRRFSGRAVLVLVVVGGLMAIVRLLQPPGAGAWLFELVAGAFLCIHLPLIVRHVGNVYLLRLVARSNAAEGHLRYRRWAVLRLSAMAMGLWAGVYGLMALVAALLPRRRAGLPGRGLRAAPAGRATPLTRLARPPLVAFPPRTLYLCE